MRLKLLFLLLLGINVNAQLIITPNPFNVNSGTILITYGSAGDYSLFDPLGDPNLYLYTGLETDGNASTWDYHDTWSDVNSMVPLTYNAVNSRYEATVNIGTHNYFSEPTQSVGQLPQGTFVNNWYFLIRNAPGDRQSGDLVGTNYGFTPQTLSVNDFASTDNKAYYSENTFFSNSKEKLQVAVYNLCGQKINDFELNQNEPKTVDLSQNGAYIAVVSGENYYQRLKFIK